MRDRKQGTFLCVSSVAGQFGSQTDPPYSASKAAGINFIQCLAKDLAPHNVRCNSLCPGMVQTPLNRREYLQAIQTVLRMNNIALLPVGDKFLKVVPA